MRKTFCILLLVLCPFFITTFAATAPSKTQVLAAIATIENNPLTATGGNAKTIYEFGKESPDVFISFSPDYMPWLTEIDEKDSKSAGPLLLISYLAGNMKGQLERGKAQDDPYHGWLLALKTYRVLKEKENIHSESLEKFSTLEANGQLQAHAEKVLQENQKKNTTK